MGRQTASGDGSRAASAADAESIESQIEAEILRLVNRHRSALGLSSLQHELTLANLAREHSSNMARGLAPIGHDGLDKRYNAAASFLDITQMSENVGTVHNFPSSLVAGVIVSNWIDSPGHRRNLEGTYSLTGIGVARSADGTYFATEEYARR